MLLIAPGLFAPLESDFGRAQVAGDLSTATKRKATGLLIGGLRSGQLEELVASAPDEDGASGAGKGGGGGAGGSRGLFKTGSAGASGGSKQASEKQKKKQKKKKKKQKSWSLSAFSKPSGTSADQHSVGLSITRDDADAAAAPPPSAEKPAASSGSRRWGSMFKKKADRPQASSPATPPDVEEGSPGSPAASPPAVVEPARAASASSQLADEDVSPAGVAQSATEGDGGVGGDVDSGDADEIAELKRRIAELEAGQAAAKTG